MSIVPIFIVNIGLNIFAATILLFMTENNVSAWHQDLGINDTRAAELYKTNPNDPQIKQWQDALQEKINREKRVCFEASFLLPKTQEMIDTCLSLIGKVILPNCQAHPNSLLACEDPRIKKYVDTQGKGEGFPKIEEGLPLNIPK